MKRAIEKQKEEAKQDAEKLIQALQEEKEWDELNEESEESEEKDNQDIPAEDDEQVKAIQESLKQGTVKRNKKEGKSLVVKDAITVNQVFIILFSYPQPLFTPPSIPVIFQETVKDETPAVHSLVDDILEEDEDDEDDEEKEEDEVLLDDEEEKQEEEEKEITGENPWLASAVDHVSHNKSRKQEEKEEEELDVTATIAQLDVYYKEESIIDQVKASQKKEKKEKEKKEVEVHIIDKPTVDTSKKEKGPIRGILGFDEEFDQEELMNQAFSNAGAEEDFAEEKERVIREDEKEYKRKHKMEDAFAMEGWGDWAGIVSD